MRKALPDKMFLDGQSRLSLLAQLGARQRRHRDRHEREAVWNFAQLQPVSEKPWITFMGRTIRVTDMPEAARLSLGFAA